MLDLRVLRDIWTEEGARTVFAQLVTQCVKVTYPLVREVRPNPGDEGIDSFVGELDGDIRVYQSKYFCDRVGNSQKQNIRESFKTCMESKYTKKVVLWTLCIPIELDIKEEQWWQKWKKSKTIEYGCRIELWTKTNFISFRAKSEIKPVFDLALKPQSDKTDYNLIFKSLDSKNNQHPVKKLPGSSHLTDAIFVNKLEKAGVFKHLAARTAFYNFELLRTSIAESGTSGDIDLLDDLQVKILDLWENEYHQCEDEDFGKKFYSKIMNLIEQENKKRLHSPLNLDMIYLKGGMHYWADLCEAGWIKEYDKL